MNTIQKLPTLPVFRDEGTHKYFCEKSDKWLKYSTTQVCNELDEEAKANIERLRHIWQPRGETVHYCLELNGISRKGQVGKNHTELISS